MTTSPELSSSSSSSGKKKLPFQSYWFICDLDGTLVPSPFKRGGAHLPLTRSPCNEPLSAWLRGGGNLAVISTAGTNLFRQILHPLSASKTVSSMKGSLVLCGFSGAVMFRLARTSWEKVKELGVGAFHMEEVTEYRYYGGPNGSTTCISNAVCADVFAIAIEAYRKLFEKFEQDESLIEVLSTRYRENFRKLLGVRKSYSARGKVDEFNNTYLTKETLIERGKFVDRDPLVCFQSVPRAEKHSSSAYTFEEHGNDEDFVIAQISFLGIPQKLFPSLFLSPTNTTSSSQHAASSSLSSFFREKLGLKVVCQPNSVAIVKVGVDKGSAIQWMLTHPEGFANISPLRCIAVGDQPRTVDSSMLRFSSKFTLPFFSVGRPFAKNAEEVAKAPRVVRLAIENGGFVEFSDLVNAFDEEATALLFLFAMDYLQTASDAVRNNLLQFAIAQKNSNNYYNSSRGGGNSSISATSALSASSPLATEIKKTTALPLDPSQLRMPVVEQILKDLKMLKDEGAASTSDQMYMRKRAIELQTAFEATSKL